MVFIKCSKNQVWTLPPDIRVLIPPDHICYLVESFVDEIDFSEFEFRYAGIGASRKRIHGTVSVS